MTVGGMRHYSTYGRRLPETSSTRDPASLRRSYAVAKQAASGGTGRGAHSIGESRKDRLGVRMLLDGQRGSM